MGSDDRAREHLRIDYGAFASTHALSHRTHSPLAAEDARRRPMGEPMAAARVRPTRPLRGRRGRRRLEPRGCIATRARRRPTRFREVRWSVDFRPAGTRRKARYFMRPLQPNITHLLLEPRRERLKVRVAAERKREQRIPCNQSGQHAWRSTSDCFEQFHCLIFLAIPGVDPGGLRGDSHPRDRILGPRQERKRRARRRDGLLFLPCEGVTRSGKETKVVAIQLGFAMPRYKREHCLSLFPGLRPLVEQEVSPTKQLGDGPLAHGLKDLVQISMEGQGRRRDAL